MFVSRTFCFVLFYTSFYVTTCGNLFEKLVRFLLALMRIVHFVFIGLKKDEYVCMRKDGRGEQGKKYEIFERGN